jgi:hypothetical protein
MITLPVTDAQFASLSTRLLSNGIELAGPTGTLTKDGVTANYSHAAGQLTVEITHRPAYYPLSLIESKLRSWLEQSVAYDEGKAAS